MSGKRKAQKNNPTTYTLRMRGLWYLLLSLILGRTQEVNYPSFFLISVDICFEEDPHSKLDLETFSRLPVTFS